MQKSAKEALVDLFMQARKLDGDLLKGFCSPKDGSIVQA